ncbi:MAG: di-heme enzyme [Candidatus Binatia bacterium]
MSLRSLALAALCALLSLSASRAGRDAVRAPSAARLSGARHPRRQPADLEKVELGRFLFYDTRLSGNQTYACATCHRQELAFTDGLARAAGSTGQIHPRGSMSLANVAYAGTLAWANPLLLSLEEQALVPMFGEQPVELGLSGKEDELFARLREDARYRRLFAEAFPGEADPISLGTITKAIASFERTLISGNSPYDRYALGLDDDAISASAKRGEALFFDVELGSGTLRECSHCHGGFNFTASVDHAGVVAERPMHNNALYNLRCADFGLPAIDLPQCNTTPPATQCDGTGPQAMGCYPPDNTGAFGISGKTADMGKFKAPTLRNIAITGPYMHDGSVATLPEVLDHYTAGGRTIADGPFAGVGAESPARGQFILHFTLTDKQRQDLLAFLASLTDEEFLTNPRFASPFAAVRCAADCGLDGTVTVSELVSAVGISLGDASLALCVPADANGDGAVTVDELIRGARLMLEGCAD